jgi:hypothetical protein
MKGKRKSANLSKNRKKFKSPFEVGDRVYRKESTKCHQPWSGPHCVTKILSDVALEVNNEGITRHVSFFRHAL